MNLQQVMRAWLPMALVITLFCGLLYVVTQQLVRIGANEPQVAIAGDVASVLQAGADPKAILGSQSLDISTSLSPFVMIFDESGTPVASTAELNGKVPSIPKGVFDYTLIHSEDRITWQPQLGVRSATIVRHYSGAKSGFVLVGRSLREAERETQSLMYIILIGWAAALILSALGVFVLQKYDSYLLKFFP
jgi:hypothetical protein